MRELNPNAKVSKEWIIEQFYGYGERRDRRAITFTATEPGVQLFVKRSRFGWWHRFVQRVSTSRLKKSM